MGLAAPDPRPPKRRRLRRGLLLAALLMAVLAAPAALLYRARYGPEARLAQLRGHAQLQLRIGRADRAVSLLRQALAMDPRSADLHHELGLALLQQDDSTAARTSFEAAIQLSPDVIEPRLRLAYLAVTTRQIAVARRQIAWLTDPSRSARASQYAEAIALLGYQVASHEGNLAEAVAMAERAVAGSPRSIRAILARAEIALASGDLTQARRMLDRGREIAPQSVEVRLLRSRTEETAGDLAAAVRALDLEGIPVGDNEPLILRRAELAIATRQLDDLDAILATLDPEKSAAAFHYVSGIAASARRDHQDAVRHLRAALAARPTLVSARLELARTLVVLDERSVARAELQAVLDDDPLSRSARMLAARLAMLDGDFERAATEAERVLRGASRDLEAVRLLVAARARQRRTQDAEAYFAALERREPQNEIATLGRNLASLANLEIDTSIEGSEKLLVEQPAADGALEVLAATYAARRGLADALDRLRILLSTDVDMIPARLSVARVYAILGRPDIAEAEVGAVILMAPTNPAGHLALGTLAEERRDYRAAVAAAEAYLALAPQGLPGHSLLARALLALGEPARALEVAGREIPALIFGRARQHAVSLAQVGFAAAVELDDLDAAARHVATLERLGARDGPTLLAAAAFVLGRAPAPAAAGATSTTSTASAAADLLGPTGPAARAPLPDPDAAWVDALVLYQKGEHEAAAARARAAEPRGSAARSLVLVHALLALGDRAGAVRVAEDAAPPPESADDSPGPAVRALQRYAADVPAARAAQVAPRLHRLLLATAYGFQQAALGLADSVALEAGDLPLGAILSARAFRQLGKPARARRTLEGALLKHPNDLALLEALGVLLVEIGDTREAARILARAVELSPDTPRLLLFAGIARERLGDRTAALAAYRQAVALDPTSALAQNNLAWVLLEDETAVEEAMQHAVKAQQLAPQSSTVLDTLGMAQLLQDRAAEALATLSRARDLSPREPSVRRHLARAFARTGQDERALAELEMAILLAPSDPDTQTALAQREALLDRITGGRRPGSTLENAGRLALGDRVRESLGRQGSKHVYRFDATEPTRMTLRLRGPHDAAIDLRIGRIEQGATRELKRTTVPRDAEVAWRLGLPAGAHVIELIAFERASIAAYEISLATDTEATPEVDREPNDTHADAEPLAAGRRWRMTLGPQQDIDVVRLPGGGLFDVRLRALEKPLSVSLIEAGALASTVLQTWTAEPGVEAVLPRLRTPPEGLLLEVTGPPDAGAYEIEVQPVDAAEAGPGSGSGSGAAAGAASGSGAGAASGSGSGSGAASGSGSGSGAASGSGHASGDASSGSAAGAAASSPRLLEEPDDLPARAPLLARPTEATPTLSARGSISPAGDRDHVRLPEGHWALRVQAPRDLALRVEAVAAEPGGTMATLWTAPLDAGATLSVASIEAPRLGLTFFARDGSAASLAPYELTWGAPEPTIDLEPNDRPALASPLPVPTTDAAAAHHAGFDVDVYRLVGPRPEVYRVVVHALDEPVRVSLLVERPGGVVVQRRSVVSRERAFDIEQWDPGSGAPLIEVAAAGRGGRYRVSVEPATRRPGVEVEPNDDADTAMRLGLGELLHGWIDTPDDRDVYVVSGLTADETGGLDLALDTLSGLPPQVEVRYGDLEAPVAREAPPGERQLRATLPAAAGRRVFVVITAPRPTPGAPPAPDPRPTRYRLSVTRASPR